nr:Imm51 family immunity protein [Lysinibacillus timonensis]
MSIYIERDAKGNIIKEIGFDDMEKTYERSLAGLVQRIQRPGNRWTAYQHDNLGNVIRADYYDDTWETFTYDKNGMLLETANNHVTVKLERDASGQVIKEWQNDHWIESSYDELGNRSRITSSLGAIITVARNEMGSVMQMTASHSDQAQWTASIQYNELGQEIERILPGDVISKWQYDITGRPTHHRVRSQNRDTRRRVYNWDVNHRLRSMVNELTGVKVTYGYDEFSNLVWANQDSQFDFLYRSVDDVGNLYETREKSDRVYGPGSRLLETKDAKFSYDEEGNLIEKVENNGDTWKYEYYGNGMMGINSVFLGGHDRGSASLYLDVGEYKQELFDTRSYEGFEGNGYDWSSLALVFLEEKMPELKDIVNFDSEAGMFCAYSSDKIALGKFAISFKNTCEDEPIITDLFSRAELD